MIRVPATLPDLFDILKEVSEERAHEECRGILTRLSLTADRLPAVMITADYVYATWDLGLNGKHFMDVQIELDPLRVKCILHTQDIKKEIDVVI